MSVARNYYGDLSSTMSDATYSQPSSSQTANGAFVPTSYGSYNLTHETLIPSTHEMGKILKSQKLYQDLAAYSKLEPGWDGYNADPVMPGSLIDARVFVSSLPPQYFLPEPMLASDGEISLYWEINGVYLEASFPGDGTYHYIFNAGSVRFASDDVHVSSPLVNREFLSYLASI